MAEKQLTRPKDDRIVAGVCSGIGRYFDVDPNLIRLIWAVLVFGGMGSGIIIYLLAWVIIPEDEGPGPINAEYSIKEE
ncbi:MAG: PspC domain-containing protein [Methanomicrobiales archaeon]|nr:PspC domain-containing protein [Methanomicrobiales archaeon]